MKLNHINLVVNNVADAIRLFEVHFGFKCLENRKDAIGVLTNEDGFVLIFWSSKLNKESDANYPENFHIGFYQPDKESVIRLYEQLKTANVTLGSAPQKMRNTFGFYFHFETEMIEVSVLPAQTGR